MNIWVDTELLQQLRKATDETVEKFLEYYQLQQANQLYLTDHDGHTYFVKFFGNTAVFYGATSIVYDHKDQVTKTLAEARNSLVYSTYRGQSLVPLHIAKKKKPVLEVVDLIATSDATNCYKISYAYHADSMALFQDKDQYFALVSKSSHPHLEQIWLPVGEDWKYILQHEVMNKIQQAKLMLKLSQQDTQSMNFPIPSEAFDIEVTIKRRGPKLGGLKTATSLSYTVIERSGVWMEWKVRLAIKPKEAQKRLLNS